MSSANVINNTSQKATTTDALFNLGSDISEVEETLKNFFVFYGEEE